MHLFEFCILYFSFLNILDIISEYYPAMFGNNHVMVLIWSKQKSIYKKKKKAVVDSDRKKLVEPVQIKQILELI